MAYPASAYPVKWGKHVFDYKVNPNIDSAVNFSGFIVPNSKITDFINEMAVNDDFGVYCPWSTDSDLSNDEWFDTVHGSQKHSNVFFTTFWLEKVEGEPAQIQAWIRFMTENPNVILIP
jgi:hypothetical protein